MSVIDTLIFDRSLEDLAQDTNKAYYNATDLNRVGEAQIYIRDLFRSMGYIVNIEPKTNWTTADEPTVAQLREYLQCTRTLINILKSVTLPDYSTLLTYEQANTIERVLYDTHTIIRNIIEGFRVSGQFTAISAGEILPVTNPDLGRTWSEIDPLDLTWDFWNSTTFFALLYLPIEEV